MKKTERRTQIYLPKTYHDYLRDVAVKYGKSMSEVVREMIRKELAQTDFENNPFFKLGHSGFRSGIRDGSVNADKYLYSAEALGIHPKRKRRTK